MRGMWGRGGQEIRGEWVGGRAGEEGRCTYSVRRSRGRGSGSGIWGKKENVGARNEGAGRARNKRGGAGGRGSGGGG